MQLRNSDESTSKAPEIPGKSKLLPEGSEECENNSNNDDDSVIDDLMQLINPDEATARAPEVPGKLKLLREENDDSDNNSSVGDNESVIDVSGEIVELSLPESNQNSENPVELMYLYKNAFNLIPKWAGGFGKLKNLKFFGNEINLFPSEVGDLVGLESLQVKISSPEVNGLSLDKMKGLKELELSKVPPRASVLTLLSQISGLKCLTKLAVCHFSIRYLPPEIGCLNRLEHLDLSFNKMKYLPAELTYLKALISLRVANNKLVELPPGLSSLQRLENLDLSNNRLTSLDSLELGLMHNLQNLNLQYNKLLSYCQVPSWICCNLEGNGNNASVDDFINSSAEMDVYETTIQENDGNVSYNGFHHASTSISTVSSNSRCFASRRSSKRWRRQQHSLQQRARQERLNNSRKWKGEVHDQALIVKAGGSSNPGNSDVFTSEAHAEGASDIIDLDDDDDNKKLLLVSTENENLLTSVENDINRSTKSLLVGNCPCIRPESMGKEDKDECSKFDAPLTSIKDASGEQDEDSSSEISKTASKTKPKRKSPKPTEDSSKFQKRKKTEDVLNMSQKYSTVSFCSIEDHLPDGFYDAGRDRPFMPLGIYEQAFPLDSREVILMDRKSDEQLDAIVISAKDVLRLRKLNGLDKDRGIEPVDNLRVASLLALFVSDHFGGSDKSAIVERRQKTVYGSYYKKPFVCTCSTGNSDCIRAPPKQILDSVEDVVFTDLCEKSLHSIKSRRNSIVVPIGTLQFGVCRHRALLMKYLCDRMEPPVPCELVRGYLDFQPHAWNAILVKRGDSWVRMVIDACRPHDIREETDPEYFCRYIPLSRTTAYLLTENDCGAGPGSFPSLSTCEENENQGSSSLRRCNFGSVEAVAKVRTKVLCGSSADEIRSFEYKCLGEVRILGALKNSCIVEMYGHQISSKWVHSRDGTPERRVLQYAIFMEYVKGGSLRSYLAELSRAGEKRVPLELALFIARDVASALAELHSKHIMHRDVKSENILIDLDKKNAEGMPIVKLCDFDIAVPLRSFLHRCCIAHVGVPPPNTCIGTPLWMAPEVVRSGDKHHIYGLEVDIWSYGCLLLELLTLEVPHVGISLIEVENRLKMGKRPPLSDELEAFVSSNEHGMTRPGTESEKSEPEVEVLSFLIDLFRDCTKENPTDRPTAEEIYEMLLARTKSFSCSRS